MVTKTLACIGEVVGVKWGVFVYRGTEGEDIGDDSAEP